MKNKFSFSMKILKHASPPLFWFCTILKTTCKGFESMKCGKWNKDAIIAICDNTIGTSQVNGGTYQSLTSNVGRMMAFLHNCNDDFEIENDSQIGLNIENCICMLCHNQELGMRSISQYNVKCQQPSNNVTTIIYDPIPSPIWTHPTLICFSLLEHRNGLENI